MIDHKRQTIEVAAKKAITDNNYFMAVPNHPEFVDRGLEQMRACKWVINHIFSLPLGDRLTAAEKERVRETCDKYYANWSNHPNEATEAVYCAVKKSFEAIFGKELFEKE